jgi:hypothetical protein
MVGPTKWASGPAIIPTHLKRNPSLTRVQSPTRLSVCFWKGPGGGGGVQHYCTSGRGDVQHERLSSSARLLGRIPKRRRRLYAVRVPSAV